MTRTEMKTLLLTLSAVLIMIAILVSVGSAENDTNDARTSVFRSSDNQTLRSDSEKRNIFKNVIGFVIRLIDIPREKVKHTNDGKSKLVNNQVQDVTIERLISLKRPRLIFFRFARTRPVEFTTYTLQGTLVAYRVQLDGDYHMVVTGESGKTMIVEIPDPESVTSSSPFRNEIAQARHDFLTSFHPTRHWQTSNQSVTVTGIGFWDYPHFQRGAARNAIELHPVLAIVPNRLKVTSSIGTTNCLCDKGYAGSQIISLLVEENTWRLNGICETH